MEHSKELTTSHMQALSMDFGGTLNNINGGLECPAHGGWHEDAVKARVNRYCRASKALGLPNLMSMWGCAGLEEKLTACLSEGTCTDCQDFVGTNPGEHVVGFVPPGHSSSVTPIVEATVDNATGPSLCDDGLMALDGHPGCCVPNSNFIGDGACDSESPYNTAECGWDGGDCCKATCNESSIFGCKSHLGESFEEYGPHGYYCLDPSQADSVDPDRCNVEEKERIGDGKCNPMYNTVGCNFDGGDCCEQTCDDEFAFFPCGSGVVSYQCIDPRFKSETSEPTPQPTQKIVTPSPSRNPVTPAPYNKPSSLMTAQAEMFASKPSSSTVVQVPRDQPCPSDFLECGSGIFVGRNPSNRCLFYQCPDHEEQVVVSTNAGDGHPFASSIASALNGKTNEIEEVDAQTFNDPTKAPITPTNVCALELRECKDGSFVGRDPNNRCNFSPCPKDMTMASSVTSASAQSVGTSLNVCEQGLRECADGSFVGRDPNNSCDYFLCPKAMASMASSVSDEQGGRHHKDSDTTIAGEVANEFGKPHDTPEDIGEYSKGRTTSPEASNVGVVSIASSMANAQEASDKSQTQQHQPDSSQNYAQHKKGNRSR
jgi:hypothetical protein